MRRSIFPDFPVMKNSSFYPLSNCCFRSGVFCVKTTGNQMLLSGRCFLYRYAIVVRKFYESQIPPVVMATVTSLGRVAWQRVFPGTLQFDGSTATGCKRPGLGLSLGPPEFFYFMSALNVRKCRWVNLAFLSSSAAAFLLKDNILLGYFCN